MHATPTEYIAYDPASLSVQAISGLMTAAIGPRPIAFASTVDALGNPNLSPFSFFNAFGTNPPLLIFSPSRRGRDNTTKHTYENIKAVPEVVINVVNYSMVQQISLASSDYAKGVNEFKKAGFTMEPSHRIKPWRVKESPVQFECEVMQVIETGDQAGSGNLVICRIVMIHVNPEILDAKGHIDPHKIDLIGRLGADYYCRASGDAVFEVEKPLAAAGIGIDRLPPHAQNSTILTGNDLGRLGNIKALPETAEINEMRAHPEVSQIMTDFETGKDITNDLHLLAKHLIENNQVFDALKILMLKM
jgi:flavin reductase (DIM6/NTAB) family NADH-FMN oxidoreductase RutF